MTWTTRMVGLQTSMGDCNGAQARLRGATPRLRSGAAAALCWSSCEEIPHIQGKRKPSKMVGTERGHQRADRLKPQSHTTDQSDHMDQSLVKLNETKPCHVGAPKMDGSWWRGLIECGPLEKGLANHFSILTLRTPWTGWEGKKIGRWRMISPGQLLLLLLLLLLLSCFSHVWLCATP